MWYLTKYALTDGIVEIDDCYVVAAGDSVKIKRPADSFVWFGSPGKDIHNNKKDAIERANDMRDRKIASVKKQLLKLEKMSFA